MNKNEKIQTKVLSGFMELLPADQSTFDKMKDAIQSVYESYGFVSIDTPVIERAEVITTSAGGETEKQLYTFKKGDNELSLRFDLTVPLARYVAEHDRDLAFPFKRFAIGKSYRGESPQKGRFREFYQCDADIVGNGSLALANDAEIISMVNSVFTKLDIGDFCIKISNRKLLAGLAESLEEGKDAAVSLMRAVDKLEKIGEEGVQKELSESGISETSAERLFSFISSGISGDSKKTIANLKEFASKQGLVELFSLGINELEEVVNTARLLGVSEKNLDIDLSIARGLDYYTGTVFETKLRNDKIIGSVCSGGRYENLVATFGEKIMPGVGMSVGLTRLFSQLKEAELVSAGASTSAKVLIIPVSDDIKDVLRVALELRANSIATSIYFEDVKIKNKLAYADKIGVPFVVMIGEDEIKSGSYTLKNMHSGEQSSYTIPELIERLG